jgi:hypothetical protein
MVLVSGYSIIADRPIVTRNQKYNKPSSKYAEPFGLWLLERTDKHHKAAYQEPIFTNPAVLDFINDMRSSLASVIELTPKDFSIANCCTPGYGWCSGAVYASIALRDAYTEHWLESYPHDKFIETLRQRQRLAWTINTQFKRHNVPMRSHGAIGLCHASVDFEHENVVVRLSVDKEYYHLSESDALELIKVLKITDTYGIDFYSIIYPDYDVIPETALEGWFHGLNCVSPKPLPTTYVDSKD